MAKQSGIHQLRGKVGEMSYYQSTGVPGGLVRRINQGMSARVKTSEAYANTRLNNQEFRQAAHISALLGSLPVPKFRPMFLPFSQSRLTAAILELIKADTTHDWGSRNVISSGENADAMGVALNALSKNNAGEFVTGVVSYDTATEKYKADLSLTQDQLNLLVSIGADGVQVGAVYYGLAIGGKNPYDPSKYLLSTATPLGSESVTLEDLQPSTLEFARADWGAAQGSSLFDALCGVNMPYRIINNRKYILQEHCSFFSFIQVKPQA